MALAHSTGTHELQVLKDDLASVPAVELVFANTDSRKWLSVLIVLDKYDTKAERKIVEIEGQFIEAFPWFDVDFDIVYRDGRQLTDVVSPKGFQLFAR